MQHIKPGFSEDFITRAKIIFEKRAKRELSDGEVEICLERLAKLGLLACKVLQDQERPKDQKTIEK